MKSLKFLIFFISALSGVGNAQNYFQQEVNYVINVKLDDVKHELTAQETFEYINNSPDELKFIYIHLWPNAYKDNSTALAKSLLREGKTDFYFSKEEDKGYIDQLDFKINGEPARWELLKDSIDICKLYLNQPLKSNDSISISTPFHVKIPSSEISRLGHIGQSYQITQWYPKPAVYDKNGWNYMPYLNQGEFYSEFGSFDVSITLPKNYVLGATGDRVDGEEEMNFLDSKIKETETMSYFNPLDMAFPPSDTITKTVRFKQQKVHDFAWFCDKRYHVLKDEVVLPNSKRKVTTWTMFTNAEGNYWKESIKYISDAVYYYSLWNGDYPYNNCTAVDGTISAGGGMEYPNITVIGSAGSKFQLDLVIAHEVGHNWFYGILGSNERIHAWMDEGINSFYENRYVELMYPNNRMVGEFADKRVARILDIADYKHKEEYYMMYLLNAAKNQDQPIELPAYKYTPLNYGADVYSKTAVAFDYLMTYIGEEKFDAIMQQYFTEWKFKHPSPKDLQVLFEEETNKDLGWFFNDVINTTKKIDYKIAFSYRQEDGSWRIGIKNKGEIKAPVFIQGIKNDKVVAMIVYDGFSGKEVLDFPPKDVDYFKIDYWGNMPDINRNNNTIRTSGILKKVEPLKLQFLASIDNPNKTQLFYTPVVGWNNYNKLMVGMAFHNTTLPQKKFEYQVIPMYSIGTDDIAGYGRLTYNIYPTNKLFQQISIGGTTTRYAYSTNPIITNFNKIAPELTIEFKKKNATSPYTHQLRYRNISIIQDNYTVHINVDAAGNTSASYSKVSTTKNFNDLTYTFSKKDKLQPYTVKLNLQQGENMFKAGVTGNYSINYREKNKGFDLRFFAGTFLGTNASDAGPYRFRLSGQRGYQDYLYDNIYLGRTETSGKFANQFTETDGGFKFYSPLGQTSQWVTALNFKSSLGNVKLPLSVYADIGMTGKDGRTTETVLYDAGASIVVIKNICEVYFPVLICKGFQDYKTANNLKYSETIRFTLNLNLANPFDLIKKIEL
jgi:hypothetical protein